MKLRIGTRGSKLALVQAEMVKKELLAKHPTLDLEIVPIHTTGDKDKTTDLSKIGGKALFLKEIQEALFADEIDLAVHSMKDVPFALPESSKLIAVLEREDPRDVFISSSGQKLQDMTNGSVIGTSSVRRAVQLLKLRPDFQIVPFRGNVETRLEKVKSKQVDATILALAGLKRAGLYSKNHQILDEGLMIPAVGQGAICIECDSNKPEICNLVSSINHEETYKLVSAERGFLETIEGNCNTPMGAVSRLDKNRKLLLKCFLADQDTKKMVIKEITGEPVKGYDLGKEIAKMILAEM